ncbi:copper-transporting ATPase, putative [Phytophthora infestans T30-4]|uniref:P-type Cu(+) transporter n=1 Tax=Phytophthora infestans (strain T30-4) TaxID=403677 RepID=D0MZV8_PHYIT|nr:copper-transporting ATPase, putative [Phytophthora infestans T30-4]EEY65771.1 copper-transporting ATPase, putative [Phytophthora infestans T30-4]|eukprot:XP_002906370.1 copper-transporting ATPase, putative [Phytophthora infestans T30-4]
MGKRKGRRAIATSTLVDSVTSETADPSCAGGCCGGVRSDGGETAASCSSSDEEVNAAEDEGGSADGCCTGKEKEALDDCCSSKKGTGCNNSDTAETANGAAEAVGVAIEQESGCANADPKPSSCCSSKKREASAESVTSQEVPKKSSCCSSKKQKTTDDSGASEEQPKTSGCCSSKKQETSGGSKESKKPNRCSSDAPDASEKKSKKSSCCSSKKDEALTNSSCSSSKTSEVAVEVDGCCASKEKKISSGCCSKESNVEAEAKKCCSSKEPKKSSCCSSDASETRSDGCCSSSSKTKKTLSSGCCSSEEQDLPHPERSPSFLKRLMQFRSDRGASLEKQRPQSGSSGRKKTTTESLEILRLNISGMTCSGCCTRIEKFMSTQRGVTDVNVSLLTSRGIFQFDPQLVTAKHIEKTVATLGFEPSVLSSDELVSVVLQLGQSESSLKAKKVITEIDGVVSVEDIDEPAVSSASQGKALRVEYNPDVTGARRIVRHLSRELGFTVQASTPQAPSVRAGEEEVRRFTRLLFWSCLLSLPVIFVEFLLPALYPFSDGNPADVGLWGTANRLSIKDAVELACATPVLFIVARPIHESAFLALRYGGRVTMDVLISLSACTAFAFSVFTVVCGALAITQAQEGVTDPSTAPPPLVETPAKADTFFQVTVLLVTLILVGRYIETLVKARASNSVDALLRMQAKTAILLEEGDQKELYIDVVLVERGDLLKVLPGTRIPTDGVVVGGASSVDESMVTGEARKVPKESGAIVIGGSINSQGVLTVRVTHTIHESMLARMVRLVGEAQASRGVRQSIADAVAAYFTTFIIILAGVMFILWYSLAKHGHVDTQGWAPFPFALRFAITVLVISCPCAISLAVPTAVMVATTKGSQVGILFKGGRALEALEEVDAVVFDKTGTLTTAQLGVANAFIPQDTFDKRHLWSYVAAAEKSSEHSIGKALVAHAETQLQGSQVEEVQGFEAIPGCGVHCTVRGVDVRLGSLTWLKQQTYSDCRALRVPAEFVEANRRFHSLGSIVVFVVIDGELVAAVALHDTPRPEAKRVIEQLKRDGVQPWIVTGDQRGTAMSVAAALGVPEGSVLAESLPHQKVDKVRLLQSLGLRVAFVGDGVNDAPALATADVGVALGAGTDVALDAADVVLVKDDLRDLLNARALSNATNRRIKHNFAWGFLYNLLMMPIACGVLYAPLGIWIPPALAGLSELLSSVPVILFSLLLNLWKPPFGGDWGLKQQHVAIDVTESTPLLLKQR